MQNVLWFFVHSLDHVHHLGISLHCLQSETKMETKEEPHSGDEGPSVSQEKLASP